MAGSFGVSGAHPLPVRYAHRLSPIKRRGPIRNGCAGPSLPSPISHEVRQASAPHPDPMGDLVPWPWVLADPNLSSRLVLLQRLPQRFQSPDSLVCAGVGSEQIEKPRSDTAKGIDNTQMCSLCRHVAWELLSAPFQLAQSVCEPSR